MSLSANLDDLIDNDEKTLNREEKLLFKLFAESVLNNGQAISDKTTTLTWYTGQKLSGPIFTLLAITRQPVYEEYEFAITTYKRGLSAKMAAAKAVDYMVAKNFGRIDDIVFHKNDDITSEGVRWGWLKKENVIASSVCSGKPITSFIDKQSMKIAELGGVQPAEPDEVDEDSDTE